MEDHISVTSLIIVLVAAFLTPILLKRFRLHFLPVVVAEIIVGLIIGQSGFNLIEPNEWLDILSTLGFIFLMFLSGLEIDFSIFKSGKRKKMLNGRPEPHRFGVAVIIFIFILVLSYLISLALSLAGLVGNAFFMTLVISTISLGIVVPTLKESELMRSTIGQIILLVAVIADLVTMILLAVFVSFYEEEGNMWLLLLLFVAGVGLYFLGKFFKNQTFFETLSTGTVQIGMRAVFTLIMILVGLSESLGAENILGAFLAGVLVSLLSPNKEMVQQLDSFGYGFLIPIFFVMIGVELDIWGLFSNPSVVLLIPLLFLGLLLSKLIPVMVLKKWYDWRTVAGSGFLLTSTLSLVIAAAKIGERIGVIDGEMASSLILLAIIACIFTPVLFKQFFPIAENAEEKKRLKIIGANQITMPLTKEFAEEGYEVYLYHARPNHSGELPGSPDFTVEKLESYAIEELQSHGVFDSEVLVISTNDDELNTNIALEAADSEIENIITKVEAPTNQAMLKEKGINVFSTIFSSRAMMKAMIASPYIADIFATREEGLMEVPLTNQEFHGMKLRDFPFFGDTIIVRIYRGNESIIPHGDTELQLEDRLIVTGNHENISELEYLLE
ncbi:monovalent cation:proton antiporter family protein [Salimicrobium salexigens]|uniref:Transporter, CPA2 family n=1 Tax=Salimicrobium salexigens TaxID=908941 RepID=A0ABY1KXG3_9BACI|nr:monovalent cation:proton antiporter family protein [Salimicrobium salexigens]SIS77113.1 transporter, CPA2 family [Salimicrobium salexigens]